MQHIVPPSTGERWHADSREALVQHVMLARLDQSETAYAAICSGSTEPAFRKLSRAIHGGVLAGLIGQRTGAVAKLMAKVNFKKSTVVTFEILFRIVASVRVLRVRWMSGVHDVGGRRGLGPIVTEANEPPFHAPWEGRMHGIAVTCQVSGLNFTAEQRATIETMSEAAYAGTTYYEKWLWAYEKLLDAKGIVTVAEMEQRIADQAYEALADHPKAPERPSDYAAKVRNVIMGGTPHDRPLDRAAKFKPGDKVRTKNLQTTSHNRLPSYAQNKLGVIEEYFGAHCHPEAHAGGKGDVPEHLYAVKFDAVELWGAEAEGKDDAFYVDLFENYLDAA